MQTRYKTFTLCSFLFLLTINFIPLNSLGKETQSPIVVSAEAVLKSKSGRSLANETGAITSDNIEEFLPTPETVTKATEYFQSLGFTVPVSGVTLTLVGQPALFEEVFQIKLFLFKNPTTGSLIARSKEQPVIPDAIKPFVETIVFPEPPQLHP